MQIKSAEDFSRIVVMTEQTYYAISLEFLKMGIYFLTYRFIMPDRLVKHPRLRWTF